MTDELHRVLSTTIDALVAAGIADESLATVKRSRFAPTRLLPTGRAWRLGVLLLDRQGRLFEVGDVTRAVEPPRGVANKSPDAEARREWRRAAVRGRFAEGEAVNFGHTPVDVGSPTSAVIVVDGVPMVRWNAAGDLRPLEGYLAERVALHLEA